MAKVDETTKRFWGKVIACYLKYYPARIKTNNQEIERARRIVWDFKDGKEYENVAQMTADYLIENFQNEISNIVFTCVPASTSEKNEVRYKKFMERVCALSGAINGYEHVSVLQERLAIHEQRDREKRICKVQVLDFDEDFFKGKSVVCFDDILTTGGSWATYASQLETLGANILGGLFLGKTTYKQTMS